MDANESSGKDRSILDLMRSTEVASIRTATVSSEILSTTACSGIEVDELGKHLLKAASAFALVSSGNEQD